MSRLYWLSARCDAEDAAEPSRHLSPGSENTYDKIFDEDMVIVIIRHIKKQIAILVEINFSLQSVIDNIILSMYTQS